MCNEPCSSSSFLVVNLSGSNYYVRILSTIDRELLKPNASVALHKHSNALVDVLPPEADSSIMMLTSGTKTSGSDMFKPCRGNSSQWAGAFFVSALASH